MSVGVLNVSLRAFGAQLRYKPTMKTMKTMKTYPEPWKPDLGPGTAETHKNQPGTIKIDLEPWLTIKAHQERWKTTWNREKNMKTHLESWNADMEQWKTHPESWKRWYGGEDVISFVFCKKDKYHPHQHILWRKLICRWYGGQDRRYPQVVSGLTLDIADT